MIIGWFYCKMSRNLFPNSSSRSQKITFAPSDKNLMAVALPIPAAPPVIKHTLSFKRITTLLFCF